MKPESKQIRASLIQRQFWLSQLQDQSGGANNIASGFRFPAGFDKEAFIESARDVVERHAALRSQFELIDGELFQRPTQGDQIETQFHTTSVEIEANAWAEANSWLDQAASKPFDLEHGPIVRLAFVDIQYDGTTAIALIIHHIAVDLRSKELIGAEIVNRYSARIASQAYFEDPSLTDAPDYEEYCLWQANWLQQPEAAKATEFWKRNLVDKSHTLPLQTDFPRPPTLSFKGDFVSFSIAPPLQKKIDAFAKDNASNSFIVLLAAFQTLLYRYTQCGDFTVGVPLTNRRFGNFKNTVGCFVNILPIEAGISDEDSFADVVGKVRRALLLAHRHQEVPIERVVNAASTSRVTDRNPLFQVGYTYEPHMAMELEGQAVPSFRPTTGGAQLDLFFRYQTENGKIIGQLEYNTALFVSATIERMLANFQILLEAGLERPQEACSKMSLLSQSELSLLSEYNRIEATPAQELVHERITSQASRVPDSTAVVFGDQSLNYIELERKAQQLANTLRNRGIAANDLVAVFIERSELMPVALLATLKSGGAYVPIDPDYPEERVRMILEAADPKIILADANIAGRLPPSYHSRVFDLSEIRNLSLGEDESDLQTIEVKPEDLAYVIFTSGSTGRPKGVRIRHYSLANFLNAMARCPGMGVGECLLAVTTIAFDIAALEMFLPLWVGGSVDIVTRDTARDPFLLKSKLEQGEIDFMQATPTTWRMLLEAGWQGSRRLKVLCGGEAFPPELVKPLVQTCGSVWNMYGPTETTIWSTLLALSDPEAESVPIGKPIDQTQVFILDENRQLLPTGCVGELYIGGEGLAEGYHLRDDLTRSTFFQSPLAAHWREKRIYRTGDLARFTHQKNLECLGRTDFQVKIRGFRVELGEIESAIKQHPDVENAVVVAKEHRLIAYINWRSEEPLSTTDMRQFIGARLAEYMVPSMLVYLEALPLTQNGKIDRKALPDPIQQESEQEDQTEPSTEIEKSIAKIWQQLLSLKKVGIRNNFFALGGNSILVVQMQSDLKNIAGIEMSVVSLFKYTTIEAIAQYASNNSPIVPSNDSVQSRAKLRRSVLASRRTNR